MKRAFTAAVVLTIVGAALFVGPLVLHEPAESTYYVDAEQVDTVPDDATADPLGDVNDSVRDGVREALGDGGSVAVGHRFPSVPEYVRENGQTYHLVVSVADPGGGGGVLTLASFGLGLVAFTAAAGAAVVGLRRRSAQ